VTEWRGCGFRKFCPAWIRIVQCAGLNASTHRVADLSPGFADRSSVRYPNDVLSCKMTIATGKGTVHSAAYDLADWGLREKHASGSP